jgi:hypothetical protein
VRRLVLLIAAGLALGACGETPRPATEPRVKLKLDARARLALRSSRRLPLTVAVALTETSGMRLTRSAKVLIRPR